MEGMQTRLLHCWELMDQCANEKTALRHHLLQLLDYVSNQHQEYVMRLLSAQVSPSNSDTSRIAVTRQAIYETREKLLAGEFSAAPVLEWLNRLLYTFSHGW